MGASATLRTSAITVEPGGTATCELALRNIGSVVDEFSFEVLGAAADWATVAPATISLFPGTEGSVQITFQPPRSSDIHAEAIPFAVKVTSKEDPEGATVQEGTVQVGAYADVGAELLPRTSRGGFQGKHQVAIDNRGNQTVNASLEAVDLDQHLRFEFKPPAVVGEPGTATFASLRIRPKKRFLRGEPQTRPFRVLVNMEGREAVVADGTYLQDALTPKWLPKVAAILAALVLAWFMFLQPTIESRAEDKAQEATEKALGSLNPQLAGLDNRLKGVEAAANPGKPVPVTPTTTVSSRNVDQRLGKAVVPSATFAAAGNYDVAAKNVLSLTDLVLQNPQGDAGRLQILRGKAVLIEVRLENFRDLDYHFVTPLLFGPGQRLAVLVQCQTPGSGTKTCAPALYYAGYLTITT